MNALQDTVQYKHKILAISLEAHIWQIIMNHDSGFIIGIAMIFCQNSNRTYT